MNAGGSVIHIHAPLPVEEKCVVIDCPTCDRPRRAFAAFYEWYGATVTCAGCGEQWADGERVPRPFYRNWRADNRAMAIRHLGRLGLPA